MGTIILIIDQEQSLPCKVIIYLNKEGKITHANSKSSETGIINWNRRTDIIINGSPPSRRESEEPEEIEDTRDTNTD